MTPRHLLAIEGMTRAEIEALLARARVHLGGLDEVSRGRPLEGRVVANMFFEDSTRTRSSFEVAAKRLGAEVLNWTTRGTSVSKGETLLDTVRNIDAMGPLAIVIRHPSAGAPALCARHVGCAIINGGDGSHEHPSQALLDALTLTSHFGPLDGKKIAIVGDLLHSRVARSNLHCLRALGAQVIACGPPTMVPLGLEALGATVHHELDAALEGIDAVMMLRIQLERQAESLFPSAGEYARFYGLTTARAERLPAHVRVLHPGPINRGLELAPEVADGPRSLILDQVRSGVAVRMAILEGCA